MKWIYFILLGASWGIFGLRLGQAIWLGRFREVLARRIWLQVFLAMVAFTFFGQASERILDTIFLGKPITLYIKSISLLGMVYLYYLTLRDMDPNAHQYRYLRWIGLATFISFTIIFIYYFLFPIVSEYDFRLVMIAFRDTILSVFIIVAFLPNSSMFWQNEQIGSMRIKHAASILCSIGFVISSIGSISAGILILLKRPEPIDMLLQIFLFPMYFVAAGFLIILIPRRFFRITDYPAKLLTYWHLIQLQKRIQKLANIEDSQGEKSMGILLPQNLDLAIYRSLIFILDYYALIRTAPEGRVLYDQIQQIVRSHKPYADLVGEITKLI